MRDLELFAIMFFSMIARRLGRGVHGHHYVLHLLRLSLDLAQVRDAAVVEFFSAQQIEKTEQCSQRIGEVTRDVAHELRVLNVPMDLARVGIGGLGSLLASYQTF